MELAVVGDHAAARDPQQVRLKLHFEDATILSAQQIHEGLCDSWFLLGRHLHSVADLASHIVVAFGLRSSCPYGISLRMENFTLPPSQPVGLLKDKDVVSVYKKGIPLNRQQGEHTYSSSFDTLEKVAPIGVKTHALEEFERETGGYESEEEEEEKDTHEASLNKVDDKALKPSSMKSRKKKRKREKVERKEEQGLEIVPYTGAFAKEEDKGKKLKKQRLGDQVESQKVQHINEGIECQLRREGMQTEFSSGAKVKERKICKAISSKGDTSIKQQGNVTGSKKNASLSLSDGSSGKEVKDETRSAGHQKEGEIVKKSSRSTLRKKAKRRWKRENPEEATKINKPGVEPVKPAVEEFGAEQVRPDSPTKHEDDGDAEEERLPRVVRPGHIRFQNSDEDENGNVGPPQDCMPFLGWTNGISKRKGQSWGQEKTKRGNNNFQVTDDMEIDDMRELKLETLPAIEGTPQNGDIIAFRILELTDSFCPELSEYRVGKVLELESESGKLKLAEVPKYTLGKQDDHKQRLYEDGVLETEISSLSEIRLVQRIAYETRKSASPVEASTEIPVIDKETNLNMGADTTDDFSANLNLPKAHSPIEKSNCAQSQVWMEISDAFQRKREELASKEEPAAVRDMELGKNEELENRKETTSELDKSKVGSRGSTVVMHSDGASAGRGRAWHKRAGGLGSTMALLRSQNIV